MPRGASTRSSRPTVFPVFEQVIIKLSDPICGCEAEDLTWNVVQAKEGPTLVIECATCKTVLTVPKQKFVAGFAFRRGYQVPKTAARVKLQAIGARDAESDKFLADVMDLLKPVDDK